MSSTIVPTMNAANNGSVLTTEVKSIYRGLVFIYIVIIMENVCTIVLMCSHKKLRTKTNYILLSLAVVDCLAGFAPLCVAISMMLKIIPMRYVCQIVTASFGFLVLNSLLHLSVVTLDCYIAIVYPLHYHIYFSTRRLVGCIAFPAL